MPFGSTITLGYDARQRLTSRNSGGEVTTYDPDGVGQLTKVTLPDGSFLSYSYDAAHRLTGIQDNLGLGNSITYALDAMGNRTSEQVRDPANTLVQMRSRVYDQLNRLTQVIGAQPNELINYTSYDGNGNLTQMTERLAHTPSIVSRQTDFTYDALNR